MAHAPSTYRDIIRRLKRGTDDPRTLMAEASNIPDDGWSAQAVFHVSGDRRLQFEEAKNGLKFALQRGKAATRMTRRVELWADMAANLEDWRPGARNPEAKVLRENVVTTILADIDAMTNGAWVTDAISQLAPHMGVAGRQRLLGRALRNQGEEVPGCKAVVKAADDDYDGLVRLLDAAPAEVRAGVLADDSALDAAWAIEDSQKRAEALRVLIWKTDDPGGLQMIAKSAASQNMADQVRVWTQVGARLDKLGHDGMASLAAAEAILPNVDEAQQGKLARKLQEAKDRAGGKPAPAPERPKQQVQTNQMPVATGNTLALVNTYEGGLKAPHLRAAGRAAPLCYAFGLDLALVDFPVENLEDFVAAVETETGIGEGGRYLKQLLDAGRLMDRAPDTRVATTPKPDASKVVDLSELGKVCLLMGLGPQGLSRQLLDEVPYHYEITGTNVSLETATAMGILADRLRALS